MTNKIEANVTTLNLAAYSLMFNSGCGKTVKNRLIERTKDLFFVSQRLNQRISHLKGVKSGMITAHKN